MANCEHEIIVSTPASDDNSRCENKRQCALEYMEYKRRACKREAA
jgi:hypothetical protein